MIATKKTVPYIVLAFLIAGSFLAGYQARKAMEREETPAVVTRTETIRDTVTFTAMMPSEEKEAGTQRYKIPASRIIAGPGIKEAEEPSAGTDTIGSAAYAYAEADSAELELPLIRRHYLEKDYEAWVSGPLNPQLDSIRVYTTTRVVTRLEKAKAGRWHLGVTAGYGYCPQGFRPYVGVGITYSIFSF